MDARKACSQYINTKHQDYRSRDHAQTTRIKLCGYLRKKRNKMAGWRKMWFVLQDKLLLSYASKEEYENKLVSFKDVVYLIPGTVLRPLGGFRFTIETTSHIIYTFHCDDRWAYREWISMLLYSLAAQDNNVSSEKLVENISLNNISNSIALEQKAKCSTTRSCTTINQLGTVLEEVPASNVRLPIVENTAKILERNGTKHCTQDMAETNHENLRNICSLLEQNNEMDNGFSVKRDMKANKKSSNLALTNFKLQETSRKASNISVVEAEVNQSSSSNERTEPVYAIIDLKDKYTRREMRQRNLLTTTTRRCNSYESFLQNLTISKETNHEVMEQKTDGPTKVLDETNSKIESIYEETEQLSSKICNEENIYEPINLPKINSKTPSFLDYFNRLRISRIHQVNWFRTKHPDCKCPTQISSLDAIHKNSSNRKSIKDRMRKFCFREFQPPSLHRHNQASGEILSEKFKVRWKSIRLGTRNQKNSRKDSPSKSNRSHNLFGSLPHLKKSRISFFSNQHFRTHQNVAEAGNKSKIAI